MRLYVLREYKNGPIIRGYSYANKEEAKEMRTALRVEYPNAVVSKGPDHKHNRN